MKFLRIMCLRPSSLNEAHNSQVEGLERLGVTVLSVDFREKALEMGICKARMGILKTIDDFAPDLVLASFFSDTYELSPEFLREISAKAFLVVNSGDDELFGTWQTIYFAQSADAIMTCDYGGRFLYEQLSIPTVYFFSPVLDFVDNLLISEREIDVSFVGNCNKADRGEYIKFLRDSGISVATFGVGSGNGFVSRSEFLRIISMSKINLNFTKVDVPDEVLRVEPWRSNIRQLKARPLEVSCMKSFCLSEFSEDIWKVFSVGSEVDVFSDKDELLNKVRYYLENDAERERMASLAYDRTQKDYDKLNYLCRSFDLLHEKLHDRNGKVQKNPVFRSFEFNASEFKYNFLIFVKLLRLGRFTVALGVVPYFIKLKLCCLVGLWRGVVELVSSVFLKRK